MQLVPWCSGRTCGPVKAEIAGSNPVGTARKALLLQGFFCYFDILYIDLIRFLDNFLYVYFRKIRYTYNRIKSTYIQLLVTHSNKIQVIMNNTWSPQIRHIVFVILLVLLAAFIYYSRTLLGPLIIAALVAYLLDPAVSFFINKLHLKRKFAVPIVFLLFIAILASIPATFTPILVNQLETIGNEFLKILEFLQDTLPEINILGFTLFDYDVPGDIQEFISPLLQPQQIFGVFRAATENIAWILVIFVSSYYFLLDSRRLRDWFFSIFPEQYQDDIHILYYQIKDIWQAYLRGQLLLMFIIGIMTWLAMMAIGLPNALLVGIIAGALDLIPSLGPAVAMIVAGIIAFVAGSTYLPMSNFWFAILVIGVFSGIQFFENLWLRPRILGHRLRLHPALVFVAIIGALVLAGVLVALVIVPVIRTLEIIGRYILKRVMGLDPWTTPLVEPDLTSEKDTTVSVSEN
jgi:predicted PurR-regulated permease PerM